ncbi:hypothetical protein PR202_ga12832 [Eleusine coracana subsp. coracana]|uniref:non-specific serine/threonine protein kinase n=1 Tax=Eleusine coracana subsp. coracana TaxID=191504 RepID=A0AAV5CD65_ELECO|nr:hypothetical protein PR202_ga12832 [Eleusine coracana subsp. coracana]
MAPFFALFCLLIPSVLVLGQQPGFLSIDCGLDATYSGYKDPNRGIFYVSDEPYVDAGENHMVAAEYQGPDNRYLQTLRSFPSGLRNCYSLPTKTGDKYIVRMEIFYGNYDGKNSSSSIEFDLHLGPDYWETATPDHTYEALFVAWAAWTPVCLVNAGRGTPFVSSVELRPLGALYPPVSPDLSLSLWSRQSLGPNVVFTRYPDDTYDRYWWSMEKIYPLWANLSTMGSVQPDPDFMQPLTVLQTAVAAGGNDTILTITWQENKRSDSFMVFLHFADFQNTQLRQFGIYLNGNRLGASNKPHNPTFMAASCVYASMYRANDGSYNITLAATSMSMLPPMLNALEVYTIIANDSPITFPNDFDAIMAIKYEYGVKKNWMGDPCFPARYAWEGIKCSNTSGNTMRITSLDLSSSKLSGVVSTNFTLLTALQNLDLSYNNLSGSIPDSLPSLSSLQVLYFLTGRLTESSDVYCFGIVLLEIATGEPPILPGNGHIVQRVKQMISTGDIRFIADASLRGAYDVSSMWKVLDIAVMCTADSAAQRPTMAAVIAQLRESLALEEAREDSTIWPSQGSNIEAMASTFGPLAR